MVRVRVDNVTVQIVAARRRRPYARLEPGSVHVPSRAQAASRARFGAIVRLAGRLSDEEVARIVGGRVFRRNLILMPDGRVLPKAAALASVLMRGWRAGTGYSTVRRFTYRMPLWARLVGPEAWAAMVELVERVSEAIRAMRRGVVVVAR